LENEVRANEASATGDEDEIFHARYAQKRRVPILIIITAGREVVRSFGGAYTDQTGAVGWGWGERARSSGATGMAEVRIWIFVLGRCSLGPQPSTL
jgi:hypothetical protein